MGTQLSKLSRRLESCVKIQDGDEIEETAKEVLAELDTVLAEYQRLVYAINMTNSQTYDEEGRNLTSLLAERDALKERVSALDSAYSLLTSSSRYNRNEIRYVKTVDLADFRNLFNESSAALRKLDFHIQELSFTTDLLEE